MKYLIVFLACAFCAPAMAADMLVFFGTHASGAGKGFSIAHFDGQTGKLSAPEFALQTPAPGYFVIAPDGRHLYSCNSLNPAGTVSAYTFDPASEKLALLNTVPAGGGDPSYISLDEGARHALVANYQGGNVAVFAINGDGSLGARTALVQHSGHGVNPTRQTKAYAHSIRLDPSGRFALVCDLGLDEIFVYRYDKDAGTLAANDPPYATIAPGSGPRHLAFGAGGRWVYVISEMASTITQFDWDSEKGTLRQVRTVSALPADFKGESTSAEIAVGAGGKFLYASNRGDDSITVFSIDGATGSLSLIQRISSGGKTPRNFVIDPSGRWMIVTNHGSNNAVVFAVDGSSGRLAEVGDPVSVAYPFCPRFLAN